MRQYFRIVNPDITASGPKAGVGYIREPLQKLQRRTDRGLVGQDYSVMIAGFGMWVLCECEFELISHKEYFVESMQGTTERFKGYSGS